LIRGLPFKI
jgi:RNA recognition motif-containing protein